PELLKQLAENETPIERKLNPQAAQQSQDEKLTLTQSQFRLMLNEDAMATEKLAEGIRAFAADAVKLEKIVDALRTQ
ncbi:MAG TPA: transaldolase family protein, partial [Herbaspirillum sp.]|nr:transaldolase family protein [Herbaspirillum sp.]